MFSRGRLLQILEAMQGKLIVVYGDLVADRFIYGSPKRISREAPVLILRQYKDDLLLGGAGNAMSNIVALGGLPIPVGVLGNDPEGRALVELLTEKGVDCSAVLLVDGYRTPTKVRIIGGMPHSVRQQIVRYDLEDRIELSEEQKEQFSWILRDQIRIAHGALISDYGYGSVSPSLAGNLTGFSAGKPVTLDSRYDLLQYPDVTAATPNEDEAATAAGVSLLDDEGEENLSFVGESLREGLDAEALLITRGSKGMALFERGSHDPILLPVHGSDQVADVTGAGDTVIAAFTLALTAGASYLEAAKIANYAGGVVVMKMGTATVSNAELRYVVERDEEINE